MRYLADGYTITWRLVVVFAGEHGENLIWTATDTVPVGELCNSRLVKLLFSSVPAMGKALIFSIYSDATLLDKL